jgi:hypothetical protein
MVKWSVTNGMSSGGGDWEWSLKTPDGQGCDGAPMTCNVLYGMYIHFSKFLNDGDRLEMAYADAMPEHCGYAQMLARPNKEVVEFPITMVWREVSKPESNEKRKRLLERRAENIIPTVTQKPSLGHLAACTTTSTVAATTTHVIPTPWVAPPGHALVRVEGSGGCLTSSGKWTVDHSRCAVYSGKAIGDGRSLFPSFRLLILTIQ